MLHRELQRKIPKYVNEFLFEMVKTNLKDTYLVVTTPTALQNDVATFRQIYYDQEDQVMVNRSVN